MQETATDLYTIPQEHLDFCATIGQIAREKIAPRSAEIDEQAEYPWDVRKLLAEQDVLALPFPVEYGGTGTGTLMLNMAVEEIAKVDAACALILMVQELGTLPIQLFGSEELKERFLPKCASGEFSPAFALSEPEAGSDPAGMQTTAVWDGTGGAGGSKSGEGEWVINGTKNWISNLGVADFYVTFAVTDRESKRITAFVVEADRPGFSVGKLEHKLGIRASPTGQPIFEDVRVPQENVIGEVGRGLRVALATLERTRLGAAAQAVGIAQGATDYAVAYARERKQFGRPIGDFQGIEFKLADMEIKTAAARELLYKACAMADQGHPQRAKYSSMAKVFCSDTAMAVTVEAVQVLGGYGYVKEYPVERMMRDAKITQIYEGTNEIQRVVIARAMK
ncbi:MAG TPA: acyl-CoA dehydrogenase family protein [Solirubrobacteraceae bacterium]|jgi:acyl-CoA dehydrogenase|nr:acyl-CoA dehydrogenase family protein [Solirubrobacteraceae bacterium]